MSWFDRWFRLTRPPTPPEDPPGRRAGGSVSTPTQLEGRFRDRIRPAVHLRPADTTVFSRLGGLPLLPPDVPWPEWKGKPQSFLAQIDLAEIAGVLPSFLPASGLLFFFYDQEQGVWGYDPKDRGAWQVVYHAGSRTDLKERTAPAGLPPHCIFRSRPVLPHRIELLPDSDRLGRDAFTSDTDAETYCQLRQAVFADLPHHQMLGYPSPVQGDQMELECQLATNGIYLGDGDWPEHPRFSELRPGAGEWKLLLQLDSDNDTQWMWGDVGTLYFWVRERDARNANFSDVWFVLQCS